MNLWPHQQTAIDLIWRSMAEGRRRPVLMMATGAGKTKTAAAIIKRALAKGKHVVFVVPALELIEQTIKAFRREGILEIGVIQANHPETDPTRPVQVASAQTLARRAFPKADLVIVDEAHRVQRRVFEWMRLCPKLPFIGLSATPWTKGLGKHYDDLIIGATTQQLIREGYLSPFRVFAPSHPDLTGVRTVAGDYAEDELAEAMDKPKLTADVVSTWLKLGENRPTLCFAVNRAHARSLERDFRQAGVPVGYVDGNTGKDERDNVRAAFERGDLRVVVNVGVLTTGVDWDVRCLILARPTKSEMLYVQIIGRGLRSAQGKQDCLLRDTLVLTDRGEVKIQDLTTDHKVWDGVNFVKHSGAVCRGVRPVISHDGITGTPDHKVMTDDGWLSLAEAHCQQRRIARTGLGGQPLRLSDDYLSEGGGIVRQTAGRGLLRALFGRGNHRAVEYPFVQTEGEVWDVLNAGPLQRFTANGRLVHNCIILDHSDTTLNLGFVTDIHHERLSDGNERKASSSSRPERPKPMPKECTSCHYVKPAGVHKCPACGFAPHKVQDVATVQGELAHLGGKQVRASMDDKKRWYAMLLWYEDFKKYKHGWAANKFREKFGVWPNGIRVDPIEPDVKVGNWIRSTNIRWYKGQEKAKKAAEAAQHAA